MRACFVAGHKLSARMPSVFGVSRWARKLATIHATAHSHARGAESWPRQMNQLMKTGIETTSARESTVRKRSFMALNRNNVQNLVAQRSRRTQRTQRKPRN